MHFHSHAEQLHVDTTIGTGQGTYVVDASMQASRTQAYKHVDEKD